MMLTNTSAQNLFRIFSGTRQVISDTIKLGESDYKLAFEDKYKLTIELTNLGKSIELSFKKNAVIHLSSKGRTLIAKGILITTSGVPPKCDLFFTVDKEGKIIYDGKDKISFNKAGFTEALD